MKISSVRNSDNIKINYLRTQKENVYINDIVERNNVQNKEELEMLVQIIASDIGSLTNPLKLSNCFKERDKKRGIIAFCFCFCFLPSIGADFI